MIINISYVIILLEYEGGEKMEFLYKLYDNEYFGIALFIVIAILIFLFLLILFFGKKDEKKRKLEETKRLELESTNAFKETNENIESLEIPEIKQPEVLNQDQEVLPVNNLENANETEDSMINVPTLDVTDFDLKEETKENSPINIELPKIDEHKENSNENSVDIDNLFQTNLELPKENKESEEIIEKTNDVISSKIEAPFSSVYVNKEEEIKLDNTKNNNEFSFELPKMAVPESETIKENETPKAEEAEVSKVSDFDSLFGDIETETYNIEK